jgi:gamma-glutamyltranspeptidase / glutathione hydrolase
MIGFPGNVTAPQPWPRRREAPVYASNGIVAAAHPLTVSAGLTVLQNGGNAVDAAIAAAAVAAVVMPEMCGLGGDIFAIVHEPATGTRKARTKSFLGSGISPKLATIEQMRAAGTDGGTKMQHQGPLSIGVPGMVDGYFAMLRSFGTKSFGELAEHAINHAENGFPLTKDGALSIKLTAPLLSQYSASTGVFLANGADPGEGTLLRQPDLARTLRRISAEGPDIFYRGEIGAKIAAAIQQLGGAISVDDLAGHETTVTAPIETNYRGNTVYQTGIPSQGLILLEALNIVEALGDLPKGAPGIHRLIEAKKLAYADRLGYAVDPIYGATPIETLLGPDWAKKRSASIDPTKAAEDVIAAEMQDGDTTYLCVVDGSGMMVSLIQSVSSAFGSGIVAGDTGVVMNNRVGRGFSLIDGHPNIFAPGKKTMHTLNCFMIADEQGRMVITGGTPGGDGQPQWNLQMITGMIDFGWDVQATIEAPRWTSWPGTDPISLPNPYELRVESRLPEVEVDALRKLGHRIVEQGAWDGGGTAQLIARNPETGVLAGGSDPRAEGFAAGI